MRLESFERRQQKGTNGLLTKAEADDLAGLANAVGGRHRFTADIVVLSLPNPILCSASFLAKSVIGRGPDGSKQL
jgi:hypothetical protein